MTNDRQPSDSYAFYTSRVSLSRVPSYGARSPVTQPVKRNETKHDNDASTFADTRFTPYATRRNATLLSYLVCTCTRCEGEGLKPGKPATIFTNCFNTNDQARSQQEEIFPRLRCDFSKQSGIRYPRRRDNSAALSYRVRGWRRGRKFLDIRPPLKYTTILRSAGTEVYYVARLTTRSGTLDEKGSIKKLSEALLHPGVIRRPRR